MDAQRSPRSTVQSLVLVGRTGNGKSATGNTILGRRGFKSATRLAGVTRTTEVQETKDAKGRTIKVIDTPGLFDVTAGLKFVSSEIVKCMELAEGGIHAFVAVISARNRFSEEEEAAFKVLQGLFGPKVLNHMIVVFTGGDEFDDQQDFMDYLDDCPPGLWDILNKCNHRKVLFDNRTTDKNKRDAQVGQLLSLVDMVISQNGKKPYTNEYFQEVQKQKEKLGDALKDAEAMKGLAKREMEKKLRKEYDARMKEIISQIESQLKEELSEIKQFVQSMQNPGCCHFL